MGTGTLRGVILVLLLSLPALGSGSGAAHASELFTAKRLGGADGLLRIDTSNASTETVAALPEFPVEWTDLTSVPGEHRFLYAMAQENSLLNGHLSRIDTLTGDVLDFPLLDLVAIGVPGAFFLVHGIAVDPAAPATAWVVGEVLAGPTLLFTVSLSTGAVLTPGLALTGSLEGPVLAFSPDGSTLYMGGTASGGAPNFGIVDRVTGVVTSMGDPCCDLMGLAFDPEDGSLYAIEGLSSSGDLVTVDPATGTQIGAIGFISGGPSGLAFLNTPAVPALSGSGRLLLGLAVALSGLALLARGRRPSGKRSI